MEVTSQDHTSPSIGAWRQCHYGAGYGAWLYLRSYSSLIVCDSYHGILHILFDGAWLVTVTSFSYYSSARSANVLYHISSVFSSAAFEF
jgi:hypothetical protein